MLSGNSQLYPSKRSISALAGKRDSSQDGSSAASTIRGQNSTPLSSLNNSHVAVITQPITSTPSATQGQSLYTATTTPCTSSCSTQAPGGTSQIDSIIALYPALHLALLSLSLLSAVLICWLPPFLMKKSTRSLRIFSEHELQIGIRVCGIGHCHLRQCLHLDQWSQVVAVCMDQVPQMGHVLYLQWADSWSSTCKTDSRFWV